MTRQQRTRALTPGGALTRVRSEVAAQLPTDRQSLLDPSPEQSSLSLSPLSPLSFQSPLLATEASSKPAHTTPPAIEA